MKNSGNYVIVGMLAWLIAAGPVFAAVVITSVNGPNGTYTVSSTDLINTGQATYASIALTSGTAMFGSTATALNDDRIYGANTVIGYGTTAETLTPSDGATVVISFNTNVFTTGFSLTRVVSLTGSGTGQARSGQNYDLAVHTVGGSAFTTIANVNQGPDIALQEVQVSITDNLTGYLAHGVDQLRITFHTTSGEEDMYREFDVFGAPTAPEPSTGLLLGVGAGIVAWRRRQARR